MITLPVLCTCVSVFVCVFMFILSHIRTHIYILIYIINNLLHYFTTTLLYYLRIEWVLVHNCLHAVRAFQDSEPERTYIKRERERNIRAFQSGEPERILNILKFEKYDAFGTLTTDIIAYLQVWTEVVYKDI